MSKTDDKWGWVMGFAIISGLSVFLFRGRKAKAASPLTSAFSGKLTKNFAVDEFLQSDNPDFRRQLKVYKFTAQEKQNLTALAKLLQKGRDRFGTIVVTGGGRPPSLRDSQGRNYEEWLRAIGNKAAKNSQHRDFAAADVVVVNPDNRASAFKFFMGQPESNQTLIYQDKGKLGHMHISIRQPSKGGAYNTPVAAVVTDGVTKNYSPEDILGAHYKGKSK